MKFYGALVVLLSSVAYVSAQGASDCAALQSTLHLQSTTITSATHVTGGTVVSTPGSCQSSASVTASICRIQFVIQTTPTSRVHAEAWLPDQWFGRFLGLGNGGVGGCIDYSNLDYGASMHFAAVGSDNGHDGNNGQVFLNQPEVINDFAFRAIHVEAVIGKQIVQAYYKRAHQKSYYLGCSTGGRQGTQAALKFPDDFDGIVAGSPATDWNHLMAWSVELGRIVGAPKASTSPNFIPVALWNVIHDAVMRQCDGLDGVMDGIITEPDDCNFDAMSLLCSGQNTTNCLSAAQVAALKKVYSPLIGENGQLLYPRYDPGTTVAETQVLLGGNIFGIPANWYPFAIFNNTNFDFNTFDLKSIAFADTINPGGIATFNGDLSAFKSRGGKFISYHGRQDPLIASGNSKRVYELISSTMGIPNLDAFYRLFLIPGMGHCSGGPGATSFGQSGIISNAVNATENNVLLAMVDWVENGIAPDTIIGTGSSGTHRAHCRYRQKSVFNGTTFVCQA
ncbi:putative tannase and feruloyl esterase [Lyophyllum shimeji]|uniref:Carboxylic ester hydrolase n=1 Tax=Lyophyllum shimeji TaxID=47721 RepID=A0A9P3PK00_LYOSH|nr:putative tannase and feruloyl esterase [Lyophyllum shimeji]